MHLVIMNALQILKQFRFGALAQLASSACRHKRFQRSVVGLIGSLGVGTSDIKSHTLNQVQNAS